MDASQSSSGGLFHDGTSSEHMLRAAQSRVFSWLDLIREATLI